MFNVIELINIKPLVLKLKVHFATDPTDTFRPLREFEIGNFREWQQWQTKNNFTRPYLLSLIYYKPSVWLFAGVYKIISKEKVSQNHYDFKTVITEYGKNFIIRLLISFEKSFRNSYPHSGI